VKNVLSAVVTPTRLKTRIPVIDKLEKSEIPTTPSRQKDLRKREAFSLNKSKICHKKGISSFQSKIFYALLTISVIGIYRKLLT